MSIGIPGSGKTTLMKEIAGKNSLEYIGPDALREEIHGDEMDHADDKAIWVELRSRVADALNRNQGVVVDASFHTAKRRAHFIEFARQSGAEQIEALFFNIPLDVILSRNAARKDAGGKLASEDYIRRAYAELQDNLPMPEEGFDILVEVNEAGRFRTIKSLAGSVL